MNNQTQPLSEKLMYCVYHQEDVKQAIQKTLKELKDRFNDWQNKLAVIDNTSKIIKFRNWIDHNEIIDTTFKQNFGGLVE